MVTPKQAMIAGAALGSAVVRDGQRQKTSRRQPRTAVPAQTAPETCPLLLRRSRTLTGSLENHWTTTGALHGVDPGADEGARDLGRVCDCICRQRPVGEIGRASCRE